MKQTPRELQRDLNPQARHEHPTATWAPLSPYLYPMCNRWEREHQLPESVAPLVRDFLSSRAGDMEDTDEEQSDDEDALAAAQLAPVPALAPAPASARAVGKRKVADNPNPTRSLRSRR